MFRFLLIALLGISLSRPDGQFIDWSTSRKLSWSDFQGAPDRGSDNAALTSSNINFSFGYGSSGFTYSISCRFDKTRSWARLKNDYILAHEQGHFDIAEIYARKLSKALRNYRYNEHTVSTDLNKIYDKLVQEHHSLQFQYDRETDHSRNKAQQVAWLRRIADDLKSLEAYANYRK